MRDIPTAEGSITIACMIGMYACTLLGIENEFGGLLVPVVINCYLPILSTHGESLPGIGAEQRRTAWSPPGKFPPDYCMPTVHYYSTMIGYLNLLTSRLSGNWIPGKYFSFTWSEFIISVKSLPFTNSSWTHMYTFSDSILDLPIRVFLGFRLFHTITRSW